MLHKAETARRNPDPKIGVPHRCTDDGQIGEVGHEGALSPHRELGARLSLLSSSARKLRARKVTPFSENALGGSKRASHSSSGEAYVEDSSVGSLMNGSRS